MCCAQICDLGIFEAGQGYLKPEVTIRVGIDPAEAPALGGGARVLVTGASGFIGSHLVRRLTDSGADVHVVSRRPQLGYEGPAWHVADLTDARRVSRVGRRVLRQMWCSIWLAPLQGPGMSTWWCPLMMANQAAAVNLLTAVAKSAVPATRVVLAGIRWRSRMKATTRRPHSPYTAAKWSATAYARMFFALWNVRVSVLQIAMVYGPAQPDLTKLVPYVTLACHARGPHRSLSSGTRLVDWVYVDDVVDALVRTAEDGHDDRGEFSTSAAAGWCPSVTPWS